MKIIVTKPKNTPKEIIQAYKVMLYHHSTIYLGEIEKRIKRAHLLSFAIVDDQVVSSRAIKHPPIQYLARILHQARINPLLLPYFLHEIGWSVTLPEFRRQGLSSTLLDCLLCHYHGPIFATNRIGNTSPQNILRRFGFKPVGQLFQGNQEQIIINFKHNGGNL